MRESSPTHKKAIGLKIYWAWPSAPEHYLVFPHIQSLHQEACTSLLSSSFRRQPEEARITITQPPEQKPQSQKANQNDYMNHSFVEVNEAMSRAMKDHPRWTGQNDAFWQNMVHWRRKWQTTSYSCLDNPMNSMKRRYTGGQYIHEKMLNITHY